MTIVGRAFQENQPKNSDPNPKYFTPKHQANPAPSRKAETHPMFPFHNRDPNQPSIPEQSPKTKTKTPDQSSRTHKLSRVMSVVAISDSLAIANASHI